MVPLDQKHTLGGDNPLGFGGWDMGTWGLVGFRFFTGHRLDIVCDISKSDRLRHPLSSSQFPI